MRCPTSRSVRAVPAIFGFAALVLAAATVPGAAHSPDSTREALAARAVQQPPPPEKCCFTNPAYTGTCEVVPGKDETCGSILDYLNNPMSQGKGYCSNTTIRSGWKSATCSSQ